MTIYIFGYGSLINLEKNKDLRQDQIIVRELYPVMVKDLKRYFNVLGNKNNIDYRLLGVYDEPHAFCNGLLYQVSAQELEKLIKREQNYTATILDPNRLLFNYNKTLTLSADDKVICFYPNPEHMLIQEMALSVPIQPDYREICYAGAKRISQAFFEDFVKYTSWN